MNRNKITVAIVAVVLLSAVGASRWLFPKAVATQRVRVSGKASEKNASARHTQRAAVQTNSVTTLAKGSNSVANAAGAKAAGNTGVQKQEQVLMANMHELLDKEDEAGALQLARKLLTSEDTDVRGDVVSVLGWIGLKALPELSKMITDPDSEVAGSAIEQWKNAVREMPEEDAKAEVLMAGLSVIEDQEERESCLMEFNELADQLAVRSMVKLIQSGNPAVVPLAREHYESVTGEKYSSPEAAEKWIKQNK